MISKELGFKEARKRGKGRKIEVQATQQEISYQQSATDTLAIPHAPVLPDAFNVPDTGTATAHIASSTQSHWPGNFLYTPLYYQDNALNQPWIEFENKV